MVVVMDRIPLLLSGGRGYRGLLQREGLVGALLPPPSRAGRMAISCWELVLGLVKPSLLSGLSIWRVSESEGGTGRGRQEFGPSMRIGNIRV